MYFRYYGFRENIFVLILQSENWGYVKCHKMAFLTELGHFYF